MLSFPKKVVDVNKCSPSLPAGDGSGVQKQSRLASFIERIKPSTKSGSASHPATNKSDLADSDIDWKQLRKKYPYPYKQLLDPAAFRLLKIVAGRKTDPLRCKLFEDRVLTPEVKYETVSYCWGTSNDQEIIFIDGHRVAIRCSAASVLRRMRLKKADRVIWIDAICINQDDKPEKSVQLKLMGPIYFETWRNLVWLGEDDGSAAQALMTVQKVVRNIRQTTDNFKILAKTISPDSGGQAADGKLLDRRIDLGPLISLYQKAWFTRYVHQALRRGLERLEEYHAPLWRLQLAYGVLIYFRLWVAQEASIAPTSLCHIGDLTCALIDILRVAAWLCYNSVFVPPELLFLPGLRGASHMWFITDFEAWYGKSKHPTRDLTALYSLTITLDCSVPRDRIFALLGMFLGRDIGLGHLLDTDYVKKSDLEVFRDATRYMISNFGDLDVLRNKRRTPLTDSGTWPSWTVDFGHQVDATRERRLLRPANASQDIAVQPLSLKFTKGPNILALEGIAADSILSLTPTIWTIPRQKRKSIEVAKVVAWVWHLIKDLPKDPDACWNSKVAVTLTGGVDWKLRQARETHTDDFVAYLEYIQRNAECPPQAFQYPEIASYSVETLMASRYQAAFDMFAYGRRFFSTVSGSIGIGPPEMERNDCIAILFGGPNPFVLRPTESCQFRLIGECYVYGLMNGECFERVKSSAHRVFDII